MLKKDLLYFFWIRTPLVSFSSVFGLRRRRRSLCRGGGVPPRVELPLRPLPAAATAAAAAAAAATLCLPGQKDQGDDDPKEEEGTGGSRHVFPSADEGGMAAEKRGGDFRGGRRGPSSPLPMLFFPFWQQETLGRFSASDFIASGLDLHPPWVW